MALYCARIKSNNTISFKYIITASGVNNSFGIHPHCLDSFKVIFIVPLILTIRSWGVSMSTHYCLAIDTLFTIALSHKKWIGPYCTMSSLTKYKWILSISSILQRLKAIKIIRHSGVCENIMICLIIKTLQALFIISHPITILFHEITLLRKN